jgi:hypothetical protein
MKGCMTGALMVLCSGGVALAAEPGPGGYQSIVERNVFGLRPPPPPPSPEDNKPPPPKITLQGITTLMGKKLVLMKVVVAGNKPGMKTEEVPLTLTIGQKQEDVEVLEIHEEEPKWVKVNNAGTITNLNFKDNGVNLASAAPPGPPGMPPRPGAIPPPPPMPGAAVPVYTPPAPAYQRQVPHTSQRMNSAGGPSYPLSAAPTMYQAVPTAPGVAMATPNAQGSVALGGLGAPASQIQPAKNWPPELTLSPEEAAIHEAAYTMLNAKKIQSGQMPAIPGSNPILDSGNTTPQQNQRPY